MNIRHQRLSRRAGTTFVVVALQAFVSLFFLVDVAADAREGGFGLHLLVEAAAVIALLVGVVFGALQIRWLVLRVRQDAAAVATAQGALADLMRLRFQEWQLTAAEADVALFALKGCDIADIARLRQSAPGTVRAQLAKIYAKAGVKSQAGLMAHFMEELVGLNDAEPAGSAKAA
ncbi:MAG: helix-turn-helix transcriptional regulator [Chakrabartia sp.]